MNKSVNAYLEAGNKIESLVTYDFKNESPWPDVKRETDPNKKFQLYKSKKTPPFDCDTSFLALDIYEQLWGWKHEERFALPEQLSPYFSGKWERMGSDTINSFSTIYNAARKIYKDDYESISSNPLLSKFALMTHCIGNFTLVPFHLDPEQDGMSFNQCRGFRGNRNNKYFVCDFFDLSLKLIQQSTDKQTFKSYIDVFLLNDYVDDEYNVIPLFKRHKAFLREKTLSNENPEKFLPQNEQELNEYLTNVLKLIEARGNRMVSTLRKESPHTKPVETVQKSKSLKLSPKVKRYILAPLAAFAIVFLALSYYIIYIYAFHGGFISLTKKYGFSRVVSETISLWGSIFADLIKVTFVIIILLVILFFILRLALKKLWAVLCEKFKRCDKCKKFFAYERINTKLINSEQISVLMQTTERYANGDLKGTGEQYVPGTRKTYTDTYRCKYCGHEINCTYTKDRPNI